jgi:hypothetical protein
MSNWIRYAVEMTATRSMTGSPTDVLPLRTDKQRCEQ